MFLGATLPDLSKWFNTSEINAKREEIVMLIQRIGSQNRRVFIGGLKEDMSQAVIQKYFEKFGKIYQISKRYSLKKQSLAQWLKISEKVPFNIASEESSFIYMPQNVAKCRKMPRNAAKCHKMPQKICKMPQKSENAAKIRKMPRNAAKCHKIPQKIRKI